ncbi:MAG: dephospho-CoA kinase [Clostridia bacterium]|nr:dephospho-CoA kinase [Clostridia bacterium]
MTQNKKIAITGGIGTGKSEVAKIIRGMGHVVLSCDEIYSRLLDEGKFRDVFQEYFPGVIDADGTLDRKKLSEIVFSDKKKLELLTQVTNPVVMKKALSEMEKEEGTVFCEVPLLFENGYEIYFDDVIIVERRLFARIKSLKIRSNLSDADVMARISAQYVYESLNDSSFHVIYNDSDLESLHAETIKLLEKLHI